MNYVDNLPDGLLLIGEFLELFKLMRIVYGFLDPLGEVSIVVAIHVVDPNRVKVLKQEEVTDERLFLQLLR